MRKDRNCGNKKIGKQLRVLRKAQGSRSSINQREETITVDKFNLFLPYTNIDDNIIKNWNENLRSYNVEKHDVGLLGPFWEYCRGY